MEVARGLELKHKMTTETQHNVKLKVRTRPEGTGLRIGLTLQHPARWWCSKVKICTSKPTDRTRSSLGVMACGETLRTSVFTCWRVWYDLMSLWHSSGDRTQEGARETREKGGPLAGCGDNRHKDGQEPVGGQGQRSPKEKTAAGRPG